MGSALPECSICLDLIHPNDNTLSSHCGFEGQGTTGHLFHEPCLRQWRDQGHITCPIDRNIDQSLIKHKLMAWLNTAIENRSQNPGFSLESQDLSGALLDKLQLRDQRFKGTNFKAALLTRGQFQKVNFRECNFENAQLRNTAFYACRLSNANFKNATAEGVQFHGCILSQQHAQDLVETAIAHDYKPSLRGANLIHVDLKALPDVPINISDCTVRKDSIQGRRFYEQDTRITKWVDANTKRFGFITPSQQRPNPIPQPTIEDLMEEGPQTPPETIEVNGVTQRNPAYINFLRIFNGLDL